MKKRKKEVLKRLDEMGCRFIEKDGKYMAINKFGNINEFGENLSFEDVEYLTGIVQLPTQLGLF